MFDEPGALRRLLAAFLVISLSIFGLHFVRTGGSGYADSDCSVGGSDVEISIPNGASGRDVAQLLFEAKVTASIESYFRLAVADSRSQRVAPGTHKVQQHLCAKDALDQLLDKSRFGDLVSIVEGAWVSEVIPQMIAAGFTQNEISSALKSVVKPAKFQSIEGLLHPAQYSFAKGTTALSALQSMIDPTVKIMRDLGYFESKEFAAPELLTIASLVQAEGNTQDYEKISRVVRNRLKVGMPLQFDSTVHYIKKSRGSVFLSTSSTLINSPYNTYKRYGLPPGPINNPSEAAMSAAIHPARGDWLYFITVAPGDTRYTSSLDQFNTWKIEYKKNLRAGLFRSEK